MKINLAAPLYCNRCCLSGKEKQYEETLKLLELEQILERTQKLELSAYDGLELLVKAEGKRWCEP